ncbi:MAG: hypothetical protein OEY29_15585 [Gammaproteobacteria bacterium]|nr:hypothetical protein [Gammaproteobacteria bacterium]
MKGEPVSLGYAKLHGLLIFLAMSAGRPQRREYLAELFWPELPAAAGRENLRRALFNLKSALGEASQLLTAERNQVTFNHLDIWMDVDRLKAASSLSNQPGFAKKHLAQMIQAVGLYRGEFMAGYLLDGCPEFESWLETQRASLHSRMLSLLEQLANTFEREGDYETALKYALSHTELEPWSEEAHCQVMRLYALTGQNSASKRQYEMACQLLQKELGIPPGEETRQLAARIGKGEFSRSSENNLQEIICELYRAVDQPSEWVNVAHKIADCLGAEKFLFGTRDQTTLEMKGRFLWNLGDDALDAYVSHYSSVDVLSQQLERSERNRFYSSEALYAEKKLFSTELYNDFCQPNDIRHSIGLAIDIPDSSLYTQFACLWGGDTKKYRQYELSQWNSLATHLQQFIYLRQKFQHLEMQARSSEQVIERFTIAAFLCEASGHILYRNSLAENMLLTSSVFTAQSETLLFHQHHHNIKFSQLLQQAYNAADGNTVFESGDMCIESSNSSLELRVLPFSFRPEGVFNFIQPCALVMVVDSIHFASGFPDINQDSFVLPVAKQ